MKDEAKTKKQLIAELNALRRINKELEQRVHEQAQAFEEEIKEHRHAESLLIKNKSCFRALIESFPSGTVALLDRDLRYMLAGGEGYKKLG